MSSGKAFGKVILLGEHAVVYDQPALAGALGDGCEVSFSANDAGHARVRLNTDLLRVDNAEHGVCRAVRTTLVEAGLEHQAIDIDVRFSIPAGAGLGSSASMSVALPRAAWSYKRSTLDTPTLRRISQQIEQLFHGNPSGLDALLAETGSLGLFTRKGGLIPIEPGAPLTLVIADSGVPRSTQTQVAAVAARKERIGAPVDRIIEAIGQLAKQGAEAVSRADWPRLGELMNINQGLLSALGVSSPELEHLISEARKAGALGAKLTGAGGGGCVIALAPADHSQALVSALRPHAKNVFVSVLRGAVE